MADKLKNIIRKMIREALDMGTFLDPTSDPTDPQNQDATIIDAIDQITMDQETDIQDLDSMQNAKKKSLFTPQSADPELERKRKEYTNTELSGIESRLKKKKVGLEKLKSAKDSMSTSVKSDNNSSVSREDPPSDSTLGQLTSLFK